MEPDNKTPARNATPNDAGGQNKIVETYAEDMADVLEDSGGEMVKRAIAEDEKSEAEKKNLSPESKRNKLFLVVGVVLALLAIGVLSALVIFKKNISTVPVEPRFIPIVFTDKTSFEEIAELSPDEIAKVVSKRVENTDVKVGGIEAIYLTVNKKIVGFGEFLKLIESSVIPKQTDFVSDSFLFGVVNNGGPQATSVGKDFFILLKVRSFDDSFPFMLTWEKKILNDLYRFFGVYLSEDTNYLLTKDFEDGIIENKNARILYDQSRNIVLMYIFGDETSVIITNTEAAAEELILRLAVSIIKE